MSGFEAQRDDAAETGLASLRTEIDRIDAALHALLMERGEIIDRLIAVKARSGGASAFRPAREAAMMRGLAERHRGILPLAAVEGIWRIIISTFTHVQSPYAVHADMSDAAPAMRDACRFHFGFTVPLQPQGSAEAVVAAVAEARNDLGVIRSRREGGGERGGPAASSWWELLREPEAPKVIARLPFVERADHAAGLPLLVVAKPLNEAAPPDVALYAVTVAAGPVVEPQLPAPFVPLDRAGASLLVAAPGALSLSAVADALAAVSLAPPVPVGSHAAPFEVTSTAPCRPLLRSLSR